MVVVGKEVAVGEGEAMGAGVQPESGSSAGCQVHSACQVLIESLGWYE